MEQEAAREQRVHWQVQEAHVAGGLRSADERVERATRVRGEAEAAALALAGELGQLDADAAALSRQQTEWSEARSERLVALQELETASAEAEAGCRPASAPGSPVATECQDSVSAGPGSAAGGSGE